MNRCIALTPGATGNGRDTGGFERIEDCIGHRDIGRLVTPTETDPRRSQPGKLDVDPISIQAQQRCPRNDRQWDAESSGPASNDGERLASGPGDCDVAPLDDGRLLPGDRRDRRPESIRVIQIDIRDRRHAAVPGVRRVEPSA